MATHRWTMLLALAAATAALTVLAWSAALTAGRQSAAAALDDELHVLGRTVESEVERFRYLPAVVGQEGRIRAALTGGSPAAIAAADRYLKDVRAVSQAAELYVMRSDGLTIAASNAGEPSSFVGNNYRFRPYFTHAVARGAGRYYAVGVTTGVPGYFLSSAVRADGRLIGVAVVKVDMRDIEQAWQRSSTFAALADSNDVVFLTSHPSWRYRPLHRLSDKALSDIVATRKYDGTDVASAAPVFADGTALPEQTDTVDGPMLLRSLAIEPDGWRLIGARSLAPIIANARLVAALTALTGIVVCGAAFLVMQRRQFVLAKLGEHDRLERRVAERTRELAREIEDRKRAEADLREAQATLIQTAKLAALGRMSTAIVHEVSQPLSALENTLATAGVLAERGDAGGVGARMAAARAMARRIQRTVKALRAFARKEPGLRTRVPVERSIAAAVALAGHRAEMEGVTVRVEDGEALAVLADAIRLEQVLLNLIVNALDAVIGRPQPLITIRAERTCGRIAISVADNGHGIEPQLRERIAEPFFTTKETGEGLGLGLSISRAILTEYGGSLAFSSTPGEGSIFVVSLPEAEALGEVAA